MQSQTKQKTEIQNRITRSDAEPREAKWNRANQETTARNRAMQTDAKHNETNEKQDGRTAIHPSRRSEPRQHISKERQTKQCMKHRKAK